jgi:hypothetical protein
MTRSDHIDRITVGQAVEGDPSESRGERANRDAFRQRPHWIGRDRASALVAVIRAEAAAAAAAKPPLRAA